MPSIIKVERLSKTYDGGREALKHVDLEVERGEILALLGPNGAGKTTLISIVCGVVRPSSGRVTVGGHDIIADYRAARSMIGLVPQELSVAAFETVWQQVGYSRALYGKRPDPAFLEQLLKDLSLWDRKDSQIMALSGGMKRRLLIAKALSHQPDIVFLDEPTAGVDVELRHDMWRLVRRLRESGVTIILTTHYIAEAEEMADRIGIISRGELMLVESKQALMKKLGRKQLSLDLEAPLAAIPATLSAYDLALGGDGQELVYTYESTAKSRGINALLADLSKHDIRFRDLRTSESSLEEIFVSLVREGQ